MLVSVVVVSWNRREDTLEAIRSVARQSHRDIEIVVVDANSDDGSAEAVAAEYPGSVLVRLEGNRGVAGNRNAGIRAASGDILFFLDNDGIIEPGALEPVVEHFDRLPRLAAISFRVMNYFSGKLDHGSWVYPHSPETYSRVPFYTYTFTGGACALRRRALEQVGLFWEELFFAREEDDLALRLLDAGYDIIYLPSVVLRHKVSPAVRTHAGDKLRLDLRNTLWIAWKYLPAIHALRISLARSILYSARSFRIGQPSAALLGFAEALKELRAILSERRPLAQETYRRYVRLNPKMRWLPRGSSEPVYIDSRRPTAR